MTMKFQKIQNNLNNLNNFWVGLNAVKIKTCGDITTNGVPKTNLIKKISILKQKLNKLTPKLF